MYSLEQLQSVTVTETIFQREESILDAIQAMCDRAFGILDSCRGLIVCARPGALHRRAGMAPYAR